METQTQGANRWGTPLSSGQRALRATVNAVTLDAWWCLTAAIRIHTDWPHRSPDFCKTTHYADGIITMLRHKRNWKCITLSVTRNKRHGACIYTIRIFILAANGTIPCCSVLQPCYTVLLRTAHRCNFNIWEFNLCFGPHKMVTGIIVWHRSINKYRVVQTHDTWKTRMRLKEIYIILLFGSVWQKTLVIRII